MPDRDAHKDKEVCVHPKGLFKVHGGFSLSCWLPYGSVPAGAAVVSIRGHRRWTGATPLLEALVRARPIAVVTAPPRPRGGSLPSKLSLRDGSRAG